MGFSPHSKWLNRTDSQFENAKIKVKNAKSWNPDVVGMSILIMVLCFITIYHITVYVDSWQGIGQFNCLEKSNERPFFLSGSPRQN